MIHLKKRKNLRLSERLIPSLRDVPAVSQQEMKKLSISTGNFYFIFISNLIRLQDEFLSEPWLTNRFKKYMAGPKRWAWKNSR
jgi:hypothetical protein